MHHQSVMLGPQVRLLLCNSNPYPTVGHRQFSDGFVNTPWGCWGACNGAPWFWHHWDVSGSPNPHPPFAGPRHYGRVALCACRWSFWAVGLPLHMWAALLTALLTALLDQLLFFAVFCFSCPSYVTYTKFTAIQVKEGKKEFIYRHCY